MTDDRVVAVGFLTQRDLDVLGRGFRRIVPLADDGAFDDLLAQLDHVHAVPTGRGMRLVPEEDGRQEARGATDRSR